MLLRLKTRRFAPKLAALLALVALIEAACARQPATPSGSISTVTIKDDDRTITLHVGDRLVLDLGPSFAAGPRGLRPILRYPTGLLSLLGSTAGRWEFEARRPGMGTISVTLSCGPPLPLGGPPCPVGPPGGAGGRVAPAGRPFMLVVRIV